MERFGPYEVHQRLGVGGMATVHLALERGVEGFERWVALKRLLPHLGADDEFVRSFVREAQLACRLSHPNIVRIFELGRVGEDYFISMEYIEGRDIRLLLRRARKVAGPPPLQVTASLLGELLDALDYAHRKSDSAGRSLGLVHRDVSPSNLLVTTSGHLKIIDFGIAKATSEKQLTATGKIKGKIAYMAPEALHGRRRDARSDLFSVGVIAHELLTARPLFAAKHDYQTIERILNDEVVPPSAYNTNCPPVLDDFVLRAVAKDPEARFQSARQMLETLEKLAHSLHLHATNRDVASWVEWAFSLPIPRRIGTQDSTVEMPGREAGQVEADDELLDIIWGTGGGPKEPLKLDELTSLVPTEDDDVETDPVAPTPTATLFAVGPDSQLDSVDDAWDRVLTVGDPDRVGAAIDSEFEGTEPGGLAGRARGDAPGDEDSDDWRTEPSVDSLDLPSAVFSETGISALGEPLGGGPREPEAGSPLPDLSELNDDFDDTEPSEIGPSPFDAASSDDATLVEPDVLASSPKPASREEPEQEEPEEEEEEPEEADSGGEDAEVILLEPKTRRRKTDEVAIPPQPAPAPQAASQPVPVPVPVTEEPAPEPPPAQARDRGPNPAREASSGPKEVRHVMPPPAPEPAPALEPEPEPADKPLSIPPPPPVDSKLPAILIGLAAAAIIGSVVAFFVWPRDGSAPAPAIGADAALPGADAPVAIADAGPARDAASAPTERTGELPRIRAGGDEPVPDQVSARVCIDRRGQVQSVRLFDEVTLRVRSAVVRAVEKWRYKPYLRDHKPVPTCFSESIGIQR